MGAALLLVTALYWCWNWYGWREEQKSLRSGVSVDGQEFCGLRCLRGRFGKGEYVFYRAMAIRFRGGDLASLKAFPYVRQLWIDSTSGAADLSPLTTMGRLERLTLFRCSSVKDLRPLSQTGSIVFIDARYSGVRELQPLATLRRLEFARLEHTVVDDLGAFKGHPSLIALLLDQTHVTDLSPLAGMPKLQSLSVGGCPITDISALRYLPTLQTLSVDGCPITDIAALRYLPNLRQLNLRKLRGIDDFGPLEGLSRLEHLVLDDTRFSDLRLLHKMSSLRLLSVLNTDVVDLQPLLALRGLREVYLGGTRVNFRQLQTLRELPSLECVYIPEELTEQQRDALAQILPRCEVR